MLRRLSLSLKPRAPPSPVSRAGAAVLRKTLVNGRDATQEAAAFRSPPSASSGKGVLNKTGRKSAPNVIPTGGTRDVLETHRLKYLERLTEAGLAVVALLKLEYLKGGDAFIPSTDAGWGPRKEAHRVFFEAYLYAFRTSFHGVKDVSRVPIACNSGAPGSGKTTQLKLLTKFALEKDFIAVYFSLNDGTSRDQDCDKNEGDSSRLTRRILHGLLPPDISLARFWEDYARLSAQHPSSSFDDDVRNDLTKIIRAVWQKPPSTPILIAADDLRKWGKEPPAGEFSESAVLLLNGLAAISQYAAVADVNPERPDDHGPVYIAASVRSAYDPAKGVVEGSRRRVFFLPLPPLDPRRFDTVVRNCVAATVGSKEKKKVGLLLRAGLFASRHSARCLSLAVEELRETPRTTAADALSFWEAKVKEFHLLTRNAIQNFNKARTAAVDQEALLPTLFHRTPYDRGTTAFLPSMRSALHCDAAGIATFLRDAEEGTDAVCMHPYAIEALMDNSKLTNCCNPVSLEQQKLVGKLCNALRGMAAIPGADGNSKGEEVEGVGKRYAEIIVFSLAMRVSTMPQAMTLHELISGTIPKFDDRSFFATTRVERLLTSPPTPKPRPLCEAAQAFCFPGAARRFLDDPCAEAFKGTMNTIFRESNLRNISSKGYRCSKSSGEFHPPECQNNFYAHFTHPDNVLLDGCILLDVCDLSGASKRLLLGIQTKEYSTSGTNLGAKHEGRVSELSSGDHSRAEKWLKELNIVEVVTVYAGCSSEKSHPQVASVDLVHGELSGDVLKSDMAKHFKRWCYMHHEHIRRWSPSVAYYGCDARVVVHLDPRACEPEGMRTTPEKRTTDRSRGPRQTKQRPA